MRSAQSWPAMQQLEAKRLWLCATGIAGGARTGPDKRRVLPGKDIAVASRAYASSL